MIKEAIALSLAIIFGAVGDILLSTGMKAHGEIVVRHLRDIPPVLKLVFSNFYVLSGVTSMAIYFGSYMAALSMIDVSVANPLTALSYIIATVYAVFVMHERVSYLRWAGVLLITTGAACVGVSS